MRTKKDGENEKNIRGESNWCVCVSGSQFGVYSCCQIGSTFLKLFGLNYFHFTAHTRI